MAALLCGDSSMYEGKPYNRQPEDGGGDRWYYSRKEIEENSPSRLDGIDLKKETYLRKSYCTFLQDLGMRLKVPQVTIATAIIFCHRFFLRQSHTKNDRRTIATVCMFLAGKVEETPRPLKDVILVSYEIIHKKDPAAAQRIKQKEVYEQQKELILLGERVVLATLGFDLNVNHPYKPLVEAIKKFKVAQNALAQVAWNFVNDGLRTSLCLQFKPHHIAAGAIFLAAKFLKVKLPSEGEKVWWQEFDVTPRQLEEVSNQMLELYEQNRVPPSQTSEVEGSAGGGVTPRAPTKGPFATEEHMPNMSNSHGGGATSKTGTLKSTSSRPTPDQSYLDNPAVPSKPKQNQNNDYESSDVNSVPEYKRDGEINDSHRYDSEPLPHEGNMSEVQSNSKYGSEGYGQDDREKNTQKSDIKEVGDSKDNYHGRNLDYKDGTIGQSPQDAMKKIDKDKVKAALEKRKKSRGATARKMDLTDDDDLIERVLEDGIELAAENEKIKREEKQNWSKLSNRSDLDQGHQVNREDGDEDGHPPVKKWQSASGQDSDKVEEGELAILDDSDGGYRSSKSSNRKIKARNPPEKPFEAKQQQDYIPVALHHNHRDIPEDIDGGVKDSERDHKRRVQGNYV